VWLGLSSGGFGDKDGVDAVDGQQVGRNQVGLLNETGISGVGHVLIHFAGHHMEEENPAQLFQKLFLLLVVLKNLIHLILGFVIGIDIGFAL